MCFRMYSLIYAHHNLWYLGYLNLLDMQTGNKGGGVTVRKFEFRFQSFTVLVHNIGFHHKYYHSTPALLSYHTHAYSIASIACLGATEQGGNRNKHITQASTMHSNPPPTKISCLGATEKHRHVNMHNLL